MLNSLATTVATPAKWVGRDAPSMVAASSVTEHRGQRRGGIHLAYVGGEHHVEADGLGQGQVVFDVARVLVQVLAGRELQWVHEDGQHGHVALRPHLTHQGGVTLVEVPHGREEPDGATVGAYRVELGTGLGDGGEHLHGLILPQPGSTSGWDREVARRRARSATAA